MGLPLTGSTSGVSIFLLNLAFSPLGDGFLPDVLVEKRGI